MIHFLVIAVAISGVMDTESAIDTKNAIAISGVMKMAIESASKPASATVAAATATTIPTASGLGTTPPQFGSKSANANLST